MKKFIIGIWLVGIILLFFYSFTQVDLNLTLTKIPLLNGFFKSLQYIGFYQRAFSLYCYLGIIILLFVSYFGFIILAKKGLITIKLFWQIFIATAVILLFTYPAFSYDIFNYMFDAKTVIQYHVSPWQYRPLDFPGDPWLSFMHWTHRPSVYPPIWIGLSLPFYLAGLNFFITTLLSFKALMCLAFAGSVWLIYKMSTPKEKINNMVLYAFNPLVIIENSVSAHNDIVMVFFGLLGIWLLVNKDNIKSLVFLIFSVLTKYVTLLLLPVWLYGLKKKLQTTILYDFSFVAVFIFFLLWIIRVEIQPWYLVWFFPFLILTNRKKLIYLTIGLSLGLLLRYAPFLYLGNWDYPVPIIKFWLTLTPLGLTAIIISLNLFNKTLIHK